MCVVSAMGDYYGDRWKRDDLVRPYISPDTSPNITFHEAVTREEFDALKKQVEEVLEILKVAKKYDEEHGEPDCEMDEKVQILKAVAELVGVDLEEVFG